MKAQVKSSLIIIVTLLIGMLLGSLISGMLRGHRPLRPPMGQGKGRLEMMLNRVVQPSETQQVEFDQIIESYSSKLNEQHQQHTVEMKTLMDSLIDDLTPILTDDQIANLKGKMDRMSRGFRGRGKRGQQAEPKQQAEPGEADGN